MVSTGAPKRGWLAAALGSNTHCLHSPVTHWPEQQSASIEQEEEAASKVSVNEPTMDEYPPTIRKNVWLASAISLFQASQRAG